MTDIRAAVAAAAVVAATASGAIAAPVLDRTTQGFLDQVAAAGGQPIDTLTFEDARKVLSGVQSGPVAKRPASIEDTTFPVGPTGSVDVRIVRPQGAEGALPVVMYFHGGGWVMGNKDTHDRLIRELADAARAAVVFVDYTPAPDAQYPVQNEQAYAATRYVVEHGRAMNLDGTRIAVAGDSAGGNMAAAVTLMAKERGAPDIAAQVLFYPVTEQVSDNASYRSFKDGPWLTVPAMHYFLDAQFPDQASRREITAFPLSASLDQLAGLPTALVVTAENDLLRDEGEAYARKLTEAGVTVTATRYNGTIHDFVMLDALAGTPAAQAAVAQAGAFLKKALR